MIYRDVWLWYVIEMSSVCDSYWSRDYHDDTGSRVVRSTTRFVSLAFRWHMQLYCATFPGSWVWSLVLMQCCCLSTSPTSLENHFASVHQQWHIDLKMEQKRSPRSLGPNDGTINTWIDHHNGCSQGHEVDQGWWHQCHGSCCSS